MTYFLQAGLVYGIGYYTAMEQGIIRKSAFKPMFWRHHYFDWMLFAKRGTIFGVIGGAVVGTVIFGNQNLAQKVMKRRYTEWMVGTPRDFRAIQSSFVGKLF